MITPIRHVEVTNHMIRFSYPYVIYGLSLDLPLSAISHDLLNLHQ